MQINTLSFKFNSTDTAYFFKELSLKLQRNQVYFLQGDNGIGKSTFFSLLRGQKFTTSFLDASITIGSATYTARNNTLPEEFTTHVRMVRQDFNAMIADQFTFMENLQLANLSTYPSLRALPSATLSPIINALAIDLNKPAYLLSGGQRQILAILMTLQKHTKVLLLDEPTAALDRHNAQALMRQLHTLAEKLGITMIIICHDEHLVAEFGPQKTMVMTQNSDNSRTIEMGCNKCLTSQPPYPEDQP